MKWVGPGNCEKLSDSFDRGSVSLLARENGKPELIYLYKCRFNSSCMLTILFSSLQLARPVVAETSHWMLSTETMSHDSPVEKKRLSKFSRLLLVLNITTFFRALWIRSSHLCPPDVKTTANWWLQGMHLLIWPYGSRQKENLPKCWGIPLRHKDKNYRCIHTGRPEDISKHWMTHESHCSQP